MTRNRLLLHAVDLFHYSLILAYANAPKGQRLKALARLKAYMTADLGAEK